MSLICDKLWRVEDWLLLLGRQTIWHEINDLYNIVKDRRQIVTIDEFIDFNINKFNFNKFLRLACWLQSSGEIAEKH
jgi:hypothetical protein